MIANFGVVASGVVVGGGPPPGAEFAQIAASSTGFGTAIGNDDTIVLPSGIEAGDLMIAFIGIRGTSLSSFVSVPNWTVLLNFIASSTCSLVFLARFATADANDAFVIDGAGSADYTAAIFRITDHGVDNLSDDLQWDATPATGVSGPIDPASQDGGSSEKWLALAVAHASLGTNDDITGDPVDYTNVVNLRSTPTTSISSGLRIASREVETQTEDPGSFASEGEGWIGLLVLVPPVGFT